MTAATDGESLASLATENEKLSQLLDELRVVVDEIRVRSAVVEVKQAILYDPVLMAAVSKVEEKKRECGKRLDSVSIIAGLAIDK